MLVLISEFFLPVSKQLNLSKQTIPDKNLKLGNHGRAVSSGSACGIQNATGGTFNALCPQFHLFLAFGR